MKLWQEFKQFAVKGNMIDLAVGVIIGAAFGKIVTSLVEDVIMPPLGVLLGKVDFSSLFIVMPGQADKIEAAVAKNNGPLTSFAQHKQAGIAVLSYGQFLNNLIQFLIVAWAVFMLVHFLNRLKSLTEKPAEESEPVSKDCPYCMSTISAKAVRCPQCTSDLSGTVPAGA
ncbi:MAG TPA: large conductance mechanosensitive channel protein MscL [Fimbriimonas sp.]